LSFGGVATFGGGLDVLELSLASGASRRFPVGGEITAHDAAGPIRFLSLGKKDWETTRRNAVQQVKEPDQCYFQRQRRRRASSKLQDDADVGGASPIIVRLHLEAGKFFFLIIGCVCQGLYKSR